MTHENKELNPFRKAADQLDPTPKASSWDRLDTMLDNQSLVQENKSYKNKFRWIGGSAAIFILLAASFYAYNSNVKEESPQQLAYQIESLSNLEEEETSPLYDIDKLSQLNDAQMWGNLREGGPKVVVRNAEQ